MIMVTHDVGLKNFADRIIWMRDGKIQRIEIVPKDKKVEAIKRNQEDLNELKNRVKRTSHGTRTEYREPKDYMTYSQRAAVQSSASASH